MKIGGLLWFVALSLTVSSGSASASHLSDSPNLGDVRLDGAVFRKMSALFQERVFGADAHGRIYEEAVNAFRTHYDDAHGSLGWSGSKSLPEGLWQGEYWGKTMLSATVVAEMVRDEALLRDLRSRAERFVREFQHPDGYLSSYANGDFVGGPTTNGMEIFCWNVWGQKYTMWALLELAQATSSPELLVAARRMADNLLSRLDRLGLDIADTGYFAGLPSMSILKPMLILYERTKDERYRAFAQKIVRQWDRADGRAPNLVANAFGDRPYHAWYPHPERWAKAYETMSCLEGLVAYSVLEQDERVLSSVSRIADKLELSELNAVGGVGFFDHFTNAASCPNATTEPCDVTHWIRVNRELFLATDDAHRLDVLEFAFYNAFLAGVYRDGKWGAHSVRSHGTRHRTAPHQVGMKYHQCCIDNMPRTFVDFATTMLTRTPDGTLSVNLYSPGSAKLKGEEIWIAGDYPVANRVRVTVRKAKPGKVRFRRPACFDAVRVDGVEQDGAWHEIFAEGGQKTYELEFVRTPRLVAGQALAGSDPRADAFEYVSENPEMKGLARTTPAFRLVYGPLLLAKSKRLGEDREEVLRTLLSGDEPCECELAPVANTAVWGAWRAEIRQGGKSASVKVCDFASAADADDPSNAFSIWF